MPTKAKSGGRLTRYSVTVFLTADEVAHLERMGADIKTPWRAYAAGLLLANLHDEMAREANPPAPDWRADASRADLTGVQR